MILDVLQAVIYPVGFIALGYWIHLLKKAIQAQELTIRVQSEGIKAQGDIVKTIQSAFETLDTPKMLERFKALEEIIERVKNVALEEQKIVMAKQRDQFTEWAGSLAAGAIELYGKSVSYIPAQRRMEIINASHLPDILRDGVGKLAVAAPDYSLETFLAKVGQPPVLHTGGEHQVIDPFAPILGGNLQT